ncbi:hypothetical protein BDW02DRAFT_206493 [Decorospora gaudefroyi]|uniref:Uncharacterized protein n=1 Tax=Decorospora gaudefroyi TaxID=184978 RepID=A0A6A5K3B4_9PLEO|nr:hypothetical protein BDW02DRAFT_206493 [Decorospora gaudefroyi]
MLCFFVPFRISRMACVSAEEWVFTFVRFCSCWMGCSCCCTYRAYLAFLALGLLPNLVISSAVSRTWKECLVRE